MSATPSEIRGFFEEAMRVAAQAREVREKFAAMQKRARKKEIDWLQLKALAVAHDADAASPGSGRVGKLIAKATYANWYAEILKLGNMNRSDDTCSSQSVASPHGQPSGDGEAGTTAATPVVSASTIPDDHNLDIPPYLRRPFTAEAQS
jgi:hypothetical protein